MTTIENAAVDAAAPAVRRTVPFGPVFAATTLVLGAIGNTLQAVLTQVIGGRPETIAEQASVAAEHGALVTTMSLAGTLAVPLMALGFVAAAHLLARRARRTGRIAGSLLVIGMWGFLGIQISQLLQVIALQSGADGVAAATWMQELQSVPLLGIVFAMPFMIGCVLGMLVLTVGLLVTGAGVPRWIPATWLLFIVLDFTIGAVGPIDPHWLYLAGAVGLAVHVLRDGGRAWKTA